MKKRTGRISLLVGICCLMVALLAGVFSVVSLPSIPFATVRAGLSVLASHIGFMKDGSVLGMLPWTALLLLWGVMILLFRRRRPFSYFLLPLVGVMTYTLYVLSQVLQQTGRPAFLWKLVAGDGMTIRDASWRVVLLFLIETLLFVVWTLLADFLDRRYRQKVVERQRKQGEKTDEDTVVLPLQPVRRQEDPEEGSRSLRFPDVMEVPSLDHVGKKQEPKTKAKQTPKAPRPVADADKPVSPNVVNMALLKTISEGHKRRMESDASDPAGSASPSKAMATDRDGKPLSGFLQAALTAVGKEPEKPPVSASKAPTGHATGMLAEALLRAEQHADEETRKAKDPPSIPPERQEGHRLSIKERILSVAPGKKEGPKAPESVPEPEKAPSIVENPVGESEPPALEPEAMMKDEPIPEGLAEGETDLDVANGVGGLVSSNAGKSALLNRARISYRFPPESLLKSHPQIGNEIDKPTLERGARLVQTLEEFNIHVELTDIVRGPTVTMFEILPAPGVRVNTIVNLADNIALSLAATQVRIVAPIPGKSAVGIEIPNIKRDIIGFRELLAPIDDGKAIIPMALGRNLYGEPIVIDVATTPHLLIAGATGSGKSVCVNSLICSILFRRSPKQVRMILVDPKIVELNIYNGIPHLLTPVINEPKKTLKAFDFCLYEMDRRYRLLQGINARNIVGYNRKIEENRLAREKLPYIVVVIDEFADLMHTVGKELETKVSRLAAMSRAVGIHLILATQRPSVDVITGVIKSNIPTRIAFAVTSTTDSRIIIDEGGAEKLLGKGDMLYLASTDPVVTRIQGAYLSDSEVEKVVQFAGKQGEPDYIDESFFEDDVADSGSGGDDGPIDTNDDDALMEKALEIVVERRSASASYLQRRLKIGYNRAARLVEQMEEMGYVGPPNGSKPRELLKYPE